MNIDFEKGNGLVPAVIQDSRTNKVLMLGYMNEEALIKTQAEGKVTFYSRSKSRLWTKGESSGNFLYLKELMFDCDQDTILIKVDPVGPVCHTGADTCFKEDNTEGMAFLQELQDFLNTRKEEMPSGSYTTSLFQSGASKIAQKVGEEAVELVIEAMMKDNEKDFLNEASDLVYHLIVLLIHRGYGLEDIAGVLKGRHK